MNARNLKSKMHAYRIELQQDGKTDWRRIEASDPGNAFAQAQISFPEAKILRALRMGSSGYAEYLPPPVRREIKKVKPFSAKKAAANTATFIFYDQVLGIKK